MGDDTNESIDHSPDLPGQPKEALPPRELFVADAREVDAARRVRIPPHPNVIVDDEELRALVSMSLSLSIAEKVDILQSVDKFTQPKADRLLSILRDEREKFQGLNEKNNQRREAVTRKLAEEWKRREEANDWETRPTTVDLSAGERAGLLYRSIGKLVEPLGSGDAQKFFTVFLKRVACEIEQGGPSVTEGELPTIFAVELRNPDLNPDGANDPAEDMRFLSRSIRPALSKLRGNPVDAVQSHKGSIFRLALVIEGPEQPGGRVRQKHRVGVFVRMDARETWRRWQCTTFLRLMVLKAEGREFVKLDRLGPFGPLIRRVVETIGYRDDADRSELIFLVTSFTLKQILSALPSDQSCEFLMHLLELPIRWSGSVPSHDFENWFLNAVELNDGLSTDDSDTYDYGVGKFQRLLRHSPFDFATRLLIMKTYQLSPLNERYGLATQLRQLDGSTALTLKDTDTIRRPTRGELNLQSLLETNLSDFADFLRMVEAQGIERFASR